MANLSKKWGAVIGCWCVALVLIVTGVCLGLTVPSKAADETTHRVRFFDNGILVNTQYVEDGKTADWTSVAPKSEVIVFSNGAKYIFQGWSCNGSLLVNGLRPTTDIDCYAQYVAYWQEKETNVAIDGRYVWNIGDTYYYSYGDGVQYKLNQMTDTWEPMTWNGLSDFYGKNVWNIGNTYYYSGNTTSDQYKLNKETNTWESISWGGSNAPTASNKVWHIGDTYYFSRSTYGHYKLNQETNTWESMSWNTSGGIPSGSQYIWNVGDTYYYSNGSTHYKLNQATDTWEPMTWNGNNPVVDWIWNAGDTYYQSVTAYQQYKLNQATNTWELIKNGWGGYRAIDGEYVWNIGDTYYYSNGNNQCELNFIPGVENFYVNANNEPTKFAYDGESHSLLDGEPHDNVYYCLSDKNVAPAVSEKGSTAIPTAVESGAYYLYCRSEVNGYDLGWQYLGVAEIECGHLDYAWVVDQKPTLSSTGHRYAVCNLCGQHFAEETIAKLEPCEKHTWGAWVVDVEPTTESAGHQYRDCVVCGTREQEVLPELLTYDGKIAVTINGVTDDSYTNMKKVLAAISAAESDAENPTLVESTIKLLSNVNVKEVNFGSIGDCVIDLNGYVLLTDSFSVYTAGNLQIVDGRPNEKRYCRFNETDSRYEFTTDEKKVGYPVWDEVRGGVIACNSNGTLSSIASYRNAELTINGGTFLGNGYVMLQDEDPTDEVAARLVINGGYLEFCTKVADGDLKDGFSGNVAIMNQYGEVEINGGKIYGEIVMPDDLMVKMNKAVLAGQANGDLSAEDLENPAVLTEYLVAHGFTAADVAKVMSEDYEPEIIIVDLTNPQTDAVKIHQDVEIKTQYNEDGSLHYYEAVSKNSPAQQPTANNNNGAMIAISVLGAATVVMIAGVGTAIGIAAKRRKAKKA